MSEFFTWTILATYAGATLAVGMITQLLKGIKIPTRVLSYVASLVVLLVATLFTNTLTMQTGVLCLFNAVVVSLSANGGFEILKTTVVNMQSKNK